MKQAFSDIYLSDIDERRFSVRVAKAMNVTLNIIPYIHQYCLNNKVSLLIARCKTTEMMAVQEMEKDGFILMDTLVYYTRDMKDTIEMVGDKTIKIRIVKDGEEERVKEIADMAFHNYYGHYHLDSRLNQRKCDEIYSDWAYRSCMSKDVADFVLVAEMHNRIVGFMALRTSRMNESEITLNGVLPEMQKKGIYRSMILGGMQYIKKRGNTNIIVSTQIVNIAAQKAWTRLGFELSHSFYTFHKWYE